MGALHIPYLVLDEQRSEDDAVAIAQDVGLRSAEMGRAALTYARAQKAS